jgi:hypothetical protein
MRFRNSCNYFGLVTDARRGDYAGIRDWQGISGLSCVGPDTPKTSGDSRLGWPNLGEVRREVATLPPGIARL